MENLEKILNEVKPGVNFMEEKDLITNGILTSFDIITLVAKITSEFNVMLDISDLVPENFKTIETIYNMIQKKFCRRKNNKLLKSS